MQYVRNIWYAAAWSDEVSRTPLARTFLGEDVVLYRTTAGKAVALADLCPHRFVPLSRGTLVGDDIECGYHGLTFDCAGHCVGNPHGTGVAPRAARVRSYPLAERYGLAWIWVGEPGLADEETIPDYHWITDTEHYAEAHGYMRIDANYLLVMDNLTDLSHAAILHPGLQGRDLCRAEYKVTEADEEIWTRQFIPAMAIPAFIQAMTGEAGPLDQWLEMRYAPPCCMTTIFWLARPGEDREGGWASFNPNIITPETAGTTHYFWGSARNFNRDDAELTRVIVAGAKQAFEHEDRPMLEAQQRYLGDRDLMAMRPVLLPNDTGSARARRVIDRRLAQERQAGEAAVA